MNEKWNLGPLSQDFINALAARIAADVCARLSAAVPPRLLTVEQAATYLGRTTDGLRGMVKRGVVPVIRGDGRVMLDRQDLDLWIEQNRTQAD